MTEVAEMLSDMTCLNVDIQNVLTSDGNEVSESELVDWANLTYAEVIKLKGLQNNSLLDITIRLVDEDEITQLNHDYRGKNKSTNVLSFPFENDWAEFPDLNIDEAELLGDDSVNLLGDIVICHAVIVKEAQAQSKSIADHYAHMVIHGVLHLCGYDHLDDPTAEEMESIEVSILAQKQIANPYI